MLKKLPTWNFFQVWLLLQFAAAMSSFAQSPPPGFANATVMGGWNEAVGLTFTDAGTEMFVWERAGRVWVVKNNVKTLFLDIAEEVGGWHDHGLLGFALHPHFEENGYFYLLYVVDRHHLMSFGTGSYSSTINTYFSPTIGRLTRYTATQNGGNYSVVPGSRQILLGATKSTGIPIVSITHGVGTLAFGTDETLLVSTGDGASPADIDGGGAANGSYAVQALSDGIITQKEDVGSFRSQLLDCYNGKILRIDPETGSGIPSNPYYDPANPNSPASKVWALGLRNPFRFSLRPGTGSHLASDGDPGVLYIGDVQFVTWEELSVVERPGQNFGWPIFEGLAQHAQYAAKITLNRDAPNPLFGQGGCTQQFFTFQNLIKQETPTGTSTFANPCNTSQSIPASIKTFEHTRPLIDWKHSGTVGPSRTGIFNGSTASEINIGAAGSPVAGPQFGGSSAVGGVFYTGSDFPAEYQNSYFFGDYSVGWIRSLTVNDNNRPVAVKNFINTNAIVVHFATHPTGEGLYYVNFPSEIRRVYYSSNRPPVAVASLDIAYGASPHTVQFTGSQSSDPEDLPLTYEWNFGDGSPPTNAVNPSHTFSKADGLPGMYTVTLKVTDQSGVQDIATLTVSINNTPPSVEITSPLNNTLYPLNQETLYPLRATVTDQEHTSAQLTYQWQTTLHHESHQHPEPIDNLPETVTGIAPVGCDGETYFYSITLTVTDAAGASTRKEIRLYPDCESIVKVDPLITWPNPADITVGTPLSATQLNATATNDGSPVTGTFTYTPPLGTVLNSGPDQVLSVNFVPTNSILYNSVSKTATINVNPAAGSVTFYRAVNINGGALTIDGNNWEASAGAANFSYTTSNGVFASQGIALVPSTDANRATMIRSSVWGSNVALSLGAVPNGTYRVWVYVWEDNFATTFSLSLEGSVVLANHNSGGAGVWSKLGPYQATITDGTINIGASGGHAMLSGLEVWRVNAGGGNQPPVVSNPIPNQTATVASAFNYTFPLNSFSDPDPGTTLTYTATLSGGGVLPAWVTFNAGTRNFSGTPVAGDAGAIDIRVTASDGGGGTIQDVFTLIVNPATKLNPVITWANPAAINVGTPLSSTQLNATATYNAATVAGVFTYSPPAGTVLPAGAGQQLSVTFVPTDGAQYNTVNKTVIIDVNSATGPTTFYRAVNLNGLALTIDGNNWQASASAPNFTYTTSNGVFSNQSIALVPATDANRATMIRSSIWGSNITLTVAAVPAGIYQVWVYVWEDNFSTTFSLSLEGSVVKANHNSGGAGAWSKLGPYQATINDGAINIGSTGGDANVSGIEIWKVNEPVGNQPPVVSNPIPDQTATAGFPFSYTFPAGTFSDPNAGTVLQYSAALSDGNPLPAWLNFVPGTRNFNGTPQTSDIATLNVRVTASDGSDGTVNDNFAISVIANSPPVVSNAIPDQAATVGLAFTHTFPSNTFSDPNPGTVLVYTADLSNGNALPTWLAFNPGTRNFSGTPTPSDVGGLNVRVSATDGTGTAEDIFVLTVGTGSSPVVSNAIPDQNATVNLPYSFTFAANTFSDPDAGTVLVYTADLSSGDALPTWLAFNPSTRNFSGTPAPSDIGPINVRVKATDGTGTAEDIFVLTVGTGSPPVVSNAIPDQNATVNLPFSFTFAANTFSDPDVGTSLTYTADIPGGGSIPAWLTFNPGTRNFSGTPTAANLGPVDIRVTAADGTSTSVSDVFRLTVSAAAQTTFYRAINVNGAALTIDGNSWQASAGAPNFSYTTSNGVFANQSIALVPATDASRATMIRSSVWGNSVTLTVGAVPAGTYEVSLYVWEDNFATTFSVSLEGSVVKANHNSGGAGVWSKLGPYQVTINDGAINVASTGGHAMLSGIEIWRVNGPAGNQPPVVANAIPNQTATATSPFTYTFPANTFSDPNPGTTLTYTSTLSNGSALPSWLTFTPGSRTFSGTPGAGNTGPIDISVTASDGAGGSITDTFTLTVNAAGQTTFYRAINLNGVALTIDGNNWQASASAPNFSYTTSNGVFANQAVTLVPATDASRATMIRSSVWGSNINITVASVPVGTYQVWVYVWEDNFATTFSLSLEGSVVKANHNSGTAGVWSKLGPYQATITDGTINIGSVGGQANLSGVEIWSVNQGQAGARMAFGDQAEEDVSADGKSADLELTVYPNPSSGKATVEFTTKETAVTQVAIFNPRGVQVQLLYEAMLPAGRNIMLEIEPTDLVNGVYILQLINGQHVKHLKLALAR